MITFITLETYKVGNGGPGSIKIALSPYMHAQAGERYYQAITDDGCIIMIPTEKIDEYRNKVGKK